jgi:hypothetical protein
MRLQTLVDRLIEQAQQFDPEGSYSILVGKAPATDSEWVEGKKVYRWCPVIQTRLVPNYTVVLAPAPDNFRRSDLVEFHGRILNGDITRYTIKRRSDRNLISRAPQSPPTTVPG